LEGGIWNSGFTVGFQIGAWLPIWAADFPSCDGSASVLILGSEGLILPVFARTTGLIGAQGLIHLPMAVFWLFSYRIGVKC